MAVRKSEAVPSGANGPFVLQPTGRAERFGRRSQATTSPLSVELVGRDGQPPQAAAEVEWSVVKGPPGSDLGGGGGRVVTQVDLLGHASTSMRLPETSGIWVVRATLLGAVDCVDAYFRIFSDGVVSTLTVLRATPTSVDQPMNIVVLATDWLGTPITRARLGAVVALDNAPPTGATSAKASGGRRGRYQFRLRWHYAGDYALVISDTEGEASIIAHIRLLPGTANKLVLRAVDSPRQSPPYDRTVLVVEAFDRFGNAAQLERRLIWRASSGRIEAIAASPGVVAAALLLFRANDRPSSKVTVRAGRLSAQHTVELPGVFFRPLSSRGYFNPGQRFRFWVEAFAPAGGGTLKAIKISLKQPSTTRRVAVRQPNPGNGLPTVTVRDGDNGVLQLVVSGFEMSLPAESMAFVVAELEYECVEAAETCFEVLAASMTISRSPDRDHPLNPKTDYCPRQKEKIAKRLCVHFCLVTKPGGKTLDQLKADAQKQIDKAQKVFDDNIPICCPQIKIKACFDEFKWADYQPLTQGGAQPGEMEGNDYPASGPDTDKTKDAWKATDKLKQLLKKCRKPNCHTVYFLPSFKNNYAGSWSGPRATTISPNDFPETTGATGSGTGTLFNGTPDTDTVLVHELGHALIDLPRDEDKGDEHHGITDPKRVMYPGGGDDRGKFTKEECSHIFDNIDKYGGDCS